MINTLFKYKLDFADSSAFWANSTIINFGRFLQPGNFLPKKMKRSAKSLAHPISM